jgi:hypothetical protein
MCSIMAASVVDLPQPVEPASRTIPRGDLLEQAQFFEAGDVRLDVAHGQAPLATLLEQVGAEPADARHEIGKVRLALLLDAFAQMGGRHLLDDAVHPLKGREWAFDSDQLPVDTEDDRGGDLHVNIRSPTINSRL